MLLTDWLPSGRRDPKAKLREGRLVRALPVEEITLAEALRDNGYRTAIVGKWHLGGEPFSLPEHHGFDVNTGGNAHGAPGSCFFPYAGNWKIPASGRNAGPTSSPSVVTSTRWCPSRIPPASTVTTSDGNSCAGSRSLTRHHAGVRFHRAPRRVPVDSRRLRRNQKRRGPSVHETGEVPRTSVLLRASIAEGCPRGNRDFRFAPGPIPIYHPGVLKRS
jgi:hypothetical protein